MVEVKICENYEFLIWIVYLMGGSVEISYDVKWSEGGG